MCQFVFGYCHVAYLGFLTSESIGDISKYVRPRATIALIEVPQFFQTVKLIDYTVIEPLDFHLGQVGYVGYIYVFPIFLSIFFLQEGFDNDWLKLS